MSAILNFSKFNISQNVAYVVAACATDNDNKDVKMR